MMDRIYESLADRALDILLKSNKPRVLIAVAGVPGSGKSTLSNKVAQLINSKSANHLASIVVGMDGFHLTRAQLDEMDDPEEAHRRRGAPFTFDSQAVVDLVKELYHSTIPLSASALATPYVTTTKSSTIKNITAPSFDHKAKDPIPDNIVIPSETKIIFLEGLYLLLKDNPWDQISPLVDDRWYIHVDPIVARRRVAKRHVESGITSTLELGYERADGNDAANGIYISERSTTPNLIIHSIEEGSVVLTSTTELGTTHLAVRLQANP